jgi:hypothetical protein
MASFLQVGGGLLFIERASTFVYLYSLVLLVPTVQVAYCLLKLQSEFLQYKYPYLVPLTSISLHASTSNDIVGTYEYLLCTCIQVCPFTVRPAPAASIILFIRSFHLFITKRFIRITIHGKGF